MCIIIMAGSAIMKMEFVTEIYWPIVMLLSILFVLNVPVLSQLISSFTDSGKLASIISIFVILFEAIIGIVWTSGFYDSESDDRTVSMWYSLIPGMAPICIMAMMNGLIMTQDPTKYIKDSFYWQLSKVQDGTMMANSGYEIAWSCVLGYISVIVFSLLSTYIDRITPRKNGIPEHCLFFLQSLYERASVRARRGFQEITWKTGFWALGQMFAHPSILLISQEEIDQFVVQQRHKNESE